MLVNRRTMQYPYFARLSVFTSLPRVLSILDGMVGWYLTERIVISINATEHGAYQSALKGGLYP